MSKVRGSTLRDIFVTTFKKHPDQPAMNFVGSDSITYRDVGTAAAGLAESLKSAGFAKGDKIAILSENRPDWVAAYAGVIASGFVGVPILADFIPEQVTNIISHSEAKAVIVSDKLLPKVAALSAAVLRIRMESLLTDAEPRAQSRTFDPETAFPADIGAEDIAVIIYTSGTTGHSKGVVHTHGSLASNTIASHIVVDIRTSDRFLSVLPLAHTYECTIGMLAPFAVGASVHYLEKPPVASVLLPALKLVRPTFMLTVPLIMEKVYRSSVQPALEKMSAYRNPLLKPLIVWLAGKKLYKTFGGKLRFFGIGGAALAPDVERFLYDAGFPYAIGYGLTETAPLIAGVKPSLTTYRSTGGVVHGGEIRIADPRPDTGEGELQYRGPNVMKGYFKDEAKTAESFTEDGWFRTGDLATMDSKGRVFIKGRLKSMILGSTGENIYPEEIESLLNQSTEIQESLVYADDGGISALVQLKPEIADELLSAARDSGGDFLEMLSDAGSAVRHSAGSAVSGAEHLLNDAKRAASGAGHALSDAGKASLEKAAAILERIKKETNSRLSGFSRIKKIKIQWEPFEKTPSMKIKRFLYPKKKVDEPKE